MRVMVAMSGGVDSSVAAALLLAQGHEVVGFTMKLRDAAPGEGGGQRGSCCSPDDLMDARVACDALGVPHYVVDYREVFAAEVVRPFAEEYLRGRTPNPCVQCNTRVKFAPLLERARALGADALATGHYARVVEEAPGRFALHRGADRAKDQSYFLFGVPHDALAVTRFPLGDLHKAQVREEARRLGLPNWDKPDSEDICFVPTGDYARVVEEVAGPDRAPRPGPILDLRGRQVGTHEGLHHYTVGQRRGLHLATGERVYVLSLDVARDALVVGPLDALRVQGLVAEGCVWAGGAPPAAGGAVTAQIRYRHAGAAGALVARGDHAEVYFDAPQPAVTPGQAVVFYDGARVVGGGWIARALESAE
ncbi:MAG: tRNA 2-thiouridine(34) synthase MnmA [Deltaproteobacteria bacterium]|nr:tRNA 2-thiouridine(34) synthase MnmA [Deltaproteobacteria bacterium]